MRMISEKWSLPYAVAMYQRALHGNQVLSQQGPDLTSTYFSHPACHFVALTLLTISYVTFFHPWSSPATTRWQSPPLCLLWLYTNQSLSGHHFWSVSASSGSTWQTAGLIYMHLPSGFCWVILQLPLLPLFTAQLQVVSGHRQSDLCILHHCLSPAEPPWFRPWGKRGEGSCKEKNREVV